MRSPFSQARAVPPRDWSALAVALSVAVAVEIGLRVTTLPRLSRLVGAPLELRTDELAPAETRLRLNPRERRRLRAAARVTRHWPFGDTCLRHALVAGQRLRRRRPSLKVGVTKVDGVVKAHAWLVIDGVSLDPAGAATYEPLERVRGDSG